MTKRVPVAAHVNRLACSPRLAIGDRAFEPAASAKMEHERPPLPERQDGRTLVKIIRPRLTETLARERLFDQLEAARTQTLTWITGPAGSGKSTLVASYLDIRKLFCVWYQVDAGDEDPAVFFYCLSLAAQQSGLRQKHALPPDALAHAPGISAFARNFFCELFARLPKPSVLVFDNYHAAGSHSGLQDVMREGLEVVPVGCRVIMISRHAPPPALARFHVNGAMTIIGCRDLRLTRAEAQQIIAMRSRDPNILAHITHIMERTQGWVAGLVMLLEWLRAEDVDPEALASLGPETIFDYFAGELLHRIEPELREFLLRSAILPEMTVSVTAALTNENGAGHMLAELHHRNLFITRHTNARKIYQYHPLFREFLLARLEETLTPAELVSLRRRAAALLDGDGCTELAFRLLKDNCDWARIVELIKRNAERMLTQGRGQTLAEWLLALPNEVRCLNPWLLYWLANCRLARNPHEALSHFECAYHLFRKARDAHGLYACWCDAVESVWLDWDASLRRWDVWIERLDALMSAHFEFPSSTIECRVAQRMSLALTERTPAHPQRAYWHKRMLSLSRESEDPAVEVEGLALAVLADTHGDLIQASTLIQDLRSRLSNTELTPAARSLAYAALSEYYCAAGRIGDLCECSEAGVAMAEGAGAHAWDYACHYWVGAAAFLAGDCERGRDKMLYIATLPEARGCAGALYSRQLAAWDAVLQDDYGQALIHARACLASARESGRASREAWAHADLAWILHRTGENEAARASLDEAMHIARRVGSDWLEWATLALRAYFAYTHGNEQDALEHLARGRSLAKSKGYTAGAAVWMGAASPVTRWLLIKSLERGIGPDITRQQIRRSDVVPGDEMMHLENWPWTTKIYTLGQFEIVRDDRPLHFVRKPPRMPLRMLKALIAFGGRGVSEVQIIEALWPDGEGDAGHRSFATTLHRLRGLLSEGSISFNTGRLTLDPKRVWIDIGAFEYLLSKAQAERHHGRINAAMQPLEQALTLYRGHFLAGEPAAPWSGTLRNRLRTRFITAASEAAAQWERASDWKRALTCYQRGLDGDDLAEEFYQGIMRTYHRLGSRAQAIDTYHRCKRHLSISLSIKPSLATEAVYKSVRHD